MNKIALITAFPPSSGSLNEYGFHLANAIAARPDVDELVVIADKLDVEMPELDLSPKISIVRAWRFNSLTAAADIVRAARKARVNGAVYNLQTASFGDSEVPAALGLLAPMLSRAIGIPSGVIAHNLIDGVDISLTAVGKNPLRRRLLQFGGAIMTRCLLKSNYVTVTLDSFADILVEKYKASNAYMVPHGSFPSDVNAIRPVEQRPNRIVTLGKFGTYKRLERLIQAFQEAQSDLCDRQLELVIGGSDHPAAPGYLREMQDKYKDNANITFKGYVAEEDVSSFFGDARLAVFDYETTTGSSGVLHQAACFGTPAAYPLIGDFVDVTEREGICGFHYQAVDRDALKGAIVNALQDCETANEYAANNLEVSIGMPISTVAAFHVKMLKQVAKSRMMKVRYIQTANP